MSSTKATKETKLVLEDELTLLIAAIGPDNINFTVFKKMVALNPTGRNEKSYWGFFKGYKDKAKELLAANPGVENVSPHSWSYSSFTSTRTRVYSFIST